MNTDFVVYFYGEYLYFSEVNSTKTPTPETDYDHLLAMHLAQDLNQEEGLDAVVKALEKPSPSTPPHQFDVFRDRNTFSEGK